MLYHVFHTSVVCLIWYCDLLCQKLFDAIWSVIHFMLLAVIPSCPGAPSLRFLIIFLISTSSVGSRNTEAVVRSGRKSLVWNILFWQFRCQCWAYAYKVIIETICNTNWITDQCFIVNTFIRDPWCFCFIYNLFNDIPNVSQITFVRNDFCLIVNLFCVFKNRCKLIFIHLIRISVIRCWVFNKNPIQFILYNLLMISIQMTAKEGDFDIAFLLL